MQGLGKQLSKDQLQHMRDNRHQEYQNINTVYNKHINQIDAKLPEKYRTTDKDRKYQNHYRAKNEIIRKAAMTPHTDDKLANLLLKKMGYESAHQWAQNRSMSQFDNVAIHGAKPRKPISTKQYNRIFKKYMNPKTPGPYADYREERKENIWSTKYDLFNYLSAKAKPFIRTKYTQPFDKERRDKKLRRWGNAIKESPDSQSVIHKVLAERQKYSKSEAPKTFKQLYITPNDQKDLNQVNKDIKKMQGMIKNPSKYHANHVTDTIIPNYQNKYMSPSKNTKKLLGIDDGASLNKQTTGGSHKAFGYLKEKNVQPYVDNNFYDTQTHKHLSRKDLLTRTQKLAPRIQKMTHEITMPSSAKHKVLNSLSKGQGQDKHRNAALKNQRTTRHQKPSHSVAKKTRQRSQHHDGPSID